MFYNETDLFYGDGYDPRDEFDRYRTRYGGYTLDTLEEFESAGKASYDEERDVWTVRFDDGTTAELHDEFKPNP